mgnify:CR=1 FL=1
MNIVGGDFFEKDIGDYTSDTIYARAIDLMYFMQLCVLSILLCYGQTRSIADVHDRRG